MLNGIRTLIYELIESDEYFADAVLIKEDAKEISNDVDTAVAKLGLCIEVVMIGASLSSNSNNWAEFDEIFPAVIFYEQRTLNSSSKHALDLAEHFCALVKTLGGWLVDDVIPLDLDEGLTIEYVPTNRDGLVQFGVRLKSAGTAEAEFDQVATPVITETDGNITLTCATPGVVIYYTLDDTDPKPGNPTAEIYTSLFAPDEGLKLRAQAWPAAKGILASEVAELASTAGGGDGIGDEFVNLTQFRTLWNAQPGNCKFDADGNLVLETREATEGDRTMHQVHVTKPPVGQPVSVVADDAEATLN